MGVKNPQLSFDVKIPEDLRPPLRVLLAEEIINYIRERTQSGKDKSGTKFTMYTKEYTKSLDFKVAGKSKGDINLTLSGDMLASIELLSHKPGNIKIGFEKNSDENARAEGNILGTYGQPTSTGKKRDFLGFAGKEKKKLDLMIKEIVEFNTPEDAKVIKAFVEGKEKIVNSMVSKDKELSVTVKFVKDALNE
jgi:hypothetical protein